MFMKNIGLKYGLLGSIVVVVFFFVVYTIDKNLYLNPVLQWSSLLLYLGFMYLACNEDVKKNGESRDFREIIRTPFIVFLLINVGFWLFHYGLHLADPEMLKLENALQIARFKAEIAAGLGDPEQTNQLYEQIQFLEKDESLLPLSIVFSKMAMGAIGGFGLAALVSMFVRREK
jgi:Protein of unknown function (DUF4199)